MSIGLTELSAGLGPRGTAGGTEGKILFMVSSFQAPGVRYPNSLNNIIWVVLQTGERWRPLGGGGGLLSLSNQFLPVPE